MKLREARPWPLLAVPHDGRKWECISASDEARIREAMQTGFWETGWFERWAAMAAGMTDLGYDFSSDVDSKRKKLLEHLERERLENRSIYISLASHMKTLGIGVRVDDYAARAEAGELAEGKDWYTLAFLAGHVARLEGRPPAELKFYEREMIAAVDDDPRARIHRLSSLKDAGFKVDNQAKKYAAESTSLTGRGNDPRRWETFVSEARALANLGLIKPLASEQQTEMPPLRRFRS